MCVVYNSVVTIILLCFGLGLAFPRIVQDSGLSRILRPVSRGKGKSSIPYSVVPRKKRNPFPHKHVPRKYSKARSRTNKSCDRIPMVLAMTKAPLGTERYPKSPSQAGKRSGLPGGRWGKVRVCLPRDGNGTGKVRSHLVDGTGRESTISWPDGIMERFWNRSRNRSGTLSGEEKERLLLSLLKADLTTRLARPSQSQADRGSCWERQLIEVVTGLAKPARSPCLVQCTAVVESLGI